MKAAIDISGERYLAAMDNVRQKARVTVVRPNGEVTYDSGAGQEELENHKERKEIKEALKDGKGSDVRKSDTTKERSIYYAIRLENGNVLRVARTMDNVSANDIRCSSVYDRNWYIDDSHCIPFGEYGRRRNRSSSD